MARSHFSRQAFGLKRPGAARVRGPPFLWRASLSTLLVQRPSGRHHAFGRASGLPQLGTLDRPTEGQESFLKRRGIVVLHVF